MLVAATAVAALVLAGCVPPDPPPGPDPQPSWQPTVRAWSDGEPPVDAPLTATNEHWWAVVEHTGTNESTLQIYPRSGPGGSPADEPAATILTDGPAGGLAMSEHLIAYRSTGPTDRYDIGLVELDGGEWEASGWITRPMPQHSLVDLDVSDDAVVVGLRAPSNQPELPGRVDVVPLDRSGPWVEWSPDTVQELHPDAGWPAEARHRFGADVSLVQDRLAVGTSWDRVALYRHDGSAVAAEQVLVGGDPLLGAEFGRAVALDGSGAPRVALGNAGGWNFGVPQAGHVEVFELASGTWSSVRRVDARPGSGLNGLTMGSDVALHGNRLVVSSHWTPVPRAGGDGMIDDLRLEVHDLAAADTFTAELSLLDALGGADELPTASTIGALQLDLIGTHLAVSVWAGFGQQPARGASISYDLH